MMRNEGYTKQRSLVTGMLLVYLAVILSNHFFLPQMTTFTGAPAVHTSASNKFDKQPVNFTERTAKATIKETLKNPLALVALFCLTLLISLFNTRSLNKGFSLSTQRLHYNQRYAYLSICNFRI